eukprot:COSAG01_NODE_227_length_21107_cov_85.615099_15_plen_186_part_00
MCTSGRWPEVRVSFQLIGAYREWMNFVRRTDMLQQLHPKAVTPASKVPDQVMVYYTVSQSRVSIFAWMPRRQTMGEDEEVVGDGNELRLPRACRGDNAGCAHTEVRTSAELRRLFEDYHFGGPVPTVGKRAQVNLLTGHEQYWLCQCDELPAQTTASRRRYGCERIRTGDMCEVDLYGALVATSR